MNTPVSWTIQWNSDLLAIFAVRLMNGVSGSSYILTPERYPPAQTHAVKQ